MDRRKTRGGLKAVKAVAAQPTGPADPWIGRTLEGRYRIDGKLGEGGMGAVYRAEHLKLGRPVAVKVLLPELLDQRGLRQRFEREAKVLAAASNAHIVGLLDYGLEGECPYLVMELLEGETLRDRLERGGIGVGEALGLMRQLLEGLAYAHAQGMIHRDLKPANIFLQRVPHRAEVVRILDFGLAKFATGDEERDGPQLTGTGAITGTPAYMAPEQAAGGGCDATADVYASGVLLFELLAGRRPFVGAPHEVVRKHLLETAPTLASVSPTLNASPQLEALVARALAKERKERFAHGGEFLAALLAVPEAEQLMGRATAPSAVPAIAPNATRAPNRVEAAPTMLRTGGGGVALVKRKSSGRGLKLVLALVVIGALVAAGGYAYTLFDGSGGTDAPGSLGALTLEDAPVAPPVAPPPAAGGPGTVPATARPRTDPRAASGAAPVTAFARGAAPEPAQPPAVPGAPALPVAPPSAGRTALHNPWAAGVPSALASTKRVIDRGRSTSARSDRSLQAWHVAHPSDPRGALVLARSFYLRGWRPDAVEWYGNALRRDPRCGGAPHLAEDLVALATHREAGATARALIAEHVGPAALPAIDARLRDTGLSARDRQNLEMLRAAVAR